VLLQTTTRVLLAPLARAVFRPVVEGRENVPRRGPVILAANHLSFLDSVVIPLVAPRPVAFLAKAEYFRKPGLKGWLTRTCLTGIDAIPVQRGGHRGAQTSLELARDVLAAGGAFGIHPEGSRSRDGRIYRGRLARARLRCPGGPRCRSRYRPDPTRRRPATPSRPDNRALRRAIALRAAARRQ
jgi:1-acyl-sn-glycerol-3-phosphate acyltransferase